MAEAQISRAGTYWTIITNMADRPMKLIIEPFAEEWEMPKGVKFYVYLRQDLDEMPAIDYWYNSIQIYADLAVIYREREKIWDWEERDVPPPAFY